MRKHPSTVAPDQSWSRGKVGTIWHIFSRENYSTPLTVCGQLIRKSIRTELKQCPSAKDYPDAFACPKCASRFARVVAGNSSVKFDFKECKV